MTVAGAGLASRPISASASSVAAVADTDFGGEAAALNALAPAAFTNKVVAAGDDAFDALLLSYVGHGSTSLWNAGGFTDLDAAALHNTQRPFVAAMTCLNGYYHDLFTTSMAEALMLNARGGAVGVWASSALTEPGPQMEVARELYRKLFAGARIGDAVRDAKQATQDGDVRRSWILFGDPSMKLK